MKHKYGGFVGAVTNPTQSNASGIWSHEEYIDANSKNLWPIPPNIVRRSLRFNSADSAYLNRTPAVAGSKTTWTWSGWVKRGALSSFTPIYSAGPSSPRAFISFSSADKFDFRSVDSTDTQVIRLVTTQVFRDPSAWYHIVVAQDTTQATAANRVKIYVNGVQVTAFSTETYPSQNASNLAINDALEQNYGRYVNSPSDGYFSGYIAEGYFVDGQALTPTSFGEFDPQSGIWVPKPYTGTYGTNGYRLNFSDNSSTAALGLDSSGNGNNWTPANFSVISGVNNDSFPDSPSFFNTDFGTGGEVIGNYATLNPIDSGSGVTFSKGNLRFTQTSAYAPVKSSIPFENGKWYWEVTLTTPSSAGGQTYWNWGGIAPLNDSGLSSATNIQVYATTNTGPGIYKDGSLLYSITGWATGQILSWAFDVDNLTLDIYRNGVQIGARITVSAPPTGKKYAVWHDTYFNGMVLDFNFGQRRWAYPPPSGFKALCTTNLQAPSIGLSVDNRADDHFNVVTYTGNGSTQTITGVGFQPDFVWIKNRDANANHRIFDSVRGADKILYSSLTNSEAIDAASGLTAFTSNGFSIGSAQVNDNGQRFVAWCWKAGGTPTSNTQGSITSSVSANQAAGFSILTYTGTGAAATIGHGLDSAPVFVIYKNRSVSSNWIVYSLAINNASQGLMLNSTNAVFTDSTPFNGVAPTSSLLTVGTNYQTNGNGNSIVAYCWKSVSGFSAFGSYTGNGSADGTFVYTGFRPRWILIKSSSFSPTNWILHDTTRQTYNPDGNLLLPDNNGTEISNSSTDYIDILSNGFKNRGAGEAQNRTSTTYIYAAFAESPFRQALAR